MNPDPSSFRAECSGKLTRRRFRRTGSIVLHGWTMMNERTLFIATLVSQLQLFAVNFRKDNHNIKYITLKDIILYFKSLTVPQRSLYSEVVTLLKIILVMPATNALSEQTFSCIT